MKSSKIMTETTSPKARATGKKKRTQTAEGWRRSVKKICEKREGKEKTS